MGTKGRERGRMREKERKTESSPELRQPWRPARGGAGQLCGADVAGEGRLRGQGWRWGDSALKWNRPGSKPCLLSCSVTLKVSLVASCDNQIYSFHIPEMEWIWNIGRRETIFENTFRLWVRGSQHFNENNIKLSRCSEFFLHYLRAFLKVLSREVTTGCGLGARSDVWEFLVATRRSGLHI